MTQTDELTNLVADVVNLRRRGESAADFEEVRLDEVVRAGLERARRLAPQVVFAERIEPWLVRGTPERLTRLVANLLDNAIKWSPPGATVEVELRDGELIVRDHGPGFDRRTTPPRLRPLLPRRRRPGPPRLRASASRSSARSPRPTAAAPPPRTPTAAAPSCGSPSPRPRPDPGRGQGSRPRRASTTSPASRSRTRPAKSEIAPPPRMSSSMGTRRTTPRRTSATTEFREPRASASSIARIVPARIGRLHLRGVHGIGSTSRRRGRRRGRGPPG